MKLNFDKFWLIVFYVLTIMIAALIGMVAGWALWARNYSILLGEPGSILGFPIPIFIGALLGALYAIKLLFLD